MSTVWCALGVTVVTAAGSAYMTSEASADAAERAGNANTYEGNLQKAIKKMESEDAIKASKAQADKIMEQARYFRSAQMAQMAGNGIVVGEGSAQVMQDRTTELAMSDALAALYSGARGSVASNTQGRFALQKANMNTAGAEAQAASDSSAAWTKAAGTIIGAGVKRVGANYPSATTTKTD